MRRSRNTSQLRLSLHPLTRNCTPLLLSFRLQNRLVSGILHGDALDWSFESASPAFLQHLPSGRLDKYALWIPAVPRIVFPLYEAIYEAARKAGCPLDEPEG